MKRVPLATLLAVILVGLGCYHATIETGLPASNQVITQDFASCWVFGLVPPKTVEAASKCPNGVARVETQLSFVNGLVGILTLGIYTPMTIEVTCAGSGADLIGDADFLVAEDASPDEIRDAFICAAQEAYRTHNPVFVRIGH